LPSLFEEDLFLDEDDDLSLLLLDGRFTVPDELLRVEVLLFTVEPVFEEDPVLFTVDPVCEGDPVLLTVDPIFEEDPVLLTVAVVVLLFEPRFLLTLKSLSA
jgi:hypothetical protein